MSLPSYTALPVKFIAETPPPKTLPVLIHVFFSPNLPCDTWSCSGNLDISLKGLNFEQLEDNPERYKGSSERTSNYFHPYLKHIMAEMA